MTMLRLHARAKINWTLDVLGKRPDGYHNLDMLLQSVTLQDTLTIQPAAELSLETTGWPKIRVDERNLVLRAAQALIQTTGTKLGARIRLEKRVPMGAGMGGGSADAAAALLGLNKLWDLRLTHEALERIGLSIGADVPFCVRGGLQRAGGVGEVLHPLETPRVLFLVAVQPCRGLSTKDVFAALRLEDIAPVHRPNNDRAMVALKAGDLPGLASAMGNVLEPVAANLRPEIQGCVARIRATGAIRAQMTGSGSAIFGVYATERDARAALGALRCVYRNIWVMSTAKEGVVFEP
ncbi:MAG: 4-(cytidine 5'-diphospho)-2-C-methyl-D-erythritol kinase [Clostridia bacterium]|nr:4-(cytidine 5'-diphospho)-2-C-methyl-D-erythritol kinase [Clostridia bacterium]